MSGELRNYNPSKLLCSFALVQAVPGFDLNDLDLRPGLVKAPHIDGGRRANTWELETDGEDNSQYVRTGGVGVDTSGTLAFTYQQGAITNRHLSTILNADEATDLGIGTIRIKDLQGTTLCIGRGARLQGFPSLSFAGGAGTNRVWTFLVAQLVMFLGDHDLVG